MITAALVCALIAVESGGDDYAVGDHGAAVGCLQIHEAVVRDVNQRLRIHPLLFANAERLDRAQSIKICVFYLNHYATESRLGHTPTDEDYARIWNGGPNGYKNPRTYGYWNRVKTHLTAKLPTIPPT